MNIISFVALLAFIAVATVSAVDLSDNQIRTAYEQFLMKYQKTYANPAEAEVRYNIFRENMLRARAYSMNDPSAEYGVTQFSDLTPEEFASIYLPTSYTPEELKARVSKYVKPASGERKFKDLPETFDWRDRGAVTPVKNQASCGSCWAFSTVANLEAYHFLKQGTLERFSEQALVDCDHTCDPEDPRSCNSGCNGGLMHLSLEYVTKEGLPTEASYPYTGRDGKCHYSHGNGTVVEISGYQFASENADDIASFLMEHGTLSVAINAQWLQFYTSGISDPYLCNPKGLNHGVAIVGFGHGKNMFGSDVPYWIVKNSWGSSWGEKGYFKIRRGKNTCGIESYVVTAV